MTGNSEFTAYAELEVKRKQATHIALGETGSKKNGHKKCKNILDSESGFKTKQSGLFSLRS